MLHDGGDNVLGVLALRQILTNSSRSSVAMRPMRWRCNSDALTALEEEQMDFLLVSGSEINAFGGAADDDAPWRAEGGDRIAWMRHSQAIANCGADDLLARQAFLTQIVEVENKIVEEQRRRQFLDDAFNGRRLQVRENPILCQQAADRNLKLALTSSCKGTSLMLALSLREKAWSISTAVETPLPANLDALNLTRF